MKTKIIKLEETSSTNDYLSSLAKTSATDDDDITVVTAEKQTAGRGQGSNSWESEAGQNLLFSILVRPRRVPVVRQFILSEAGALAVRDTLCSYVDDISLKWPNDVYWKDYKISGTLIENRVRGRVLSDCILGTGININQKKFVSDAPNPISLSLILGHEVPRDKVLDKVVENFTRYYSMVQRGSYDEISSIYHASLYRRKGMHLFKDRKGLFKAKIERVDDDGRLILRDSAGKQRQYYFKEINFIFNE